MISDKLLYGCASRLFGSDHSKVERCHSRIETPYAFAWNVAAETDTDKYWTF